MLSHMRHSTAVTETGRQPLTSAGFFRAFGTGVVIAVRQCFGMTASQTALLTHGSIASRDSVSSMRRSSALTPSASAQHPVFSPSIAESSSHSATGAPFRAPSPAMDASSRCRPSRTSAPSISCMRAYSRARSAAFSLFVDAAAAGSSGDAGSMMSGRAAASRPR